MVKNLRADAGDPGLTLGWEDPLEEEMATHSSIPWEIPQTDEPGRLSLAGYTPWGGKELDTTEQLNNNNNFHNKPLG